MSLTQTATTTMTVEAPRPPQCRVALAAPQLRLRAPAPATTAPAATGAAGPTHPAALTRRFSFVWPFISKESAGTEPFLKSRCSQLVRQFPAFIAGHAGRAKGESSRSVRDLISRVLTQLKAVWLVLAVYLSLAVLAGLCAAVLYTFLLAAKPPGLWFLAGCIAATGGIAAVSLSATRERPGRAGLRTPARPATVVPARPLPQVQPQPQGVVAVTEVVAAVNQGL